MKSFHLDFLACVNKGEVQLQDRRSRERPSSKVSESQQSARETCNTRTSYPKVRIPLVVGKRHEHAGMYIQWELRSYCALLSKISKNSLMSQPYETAEIPSFHSSRFSKHKTLTAGVKFQLQLWAYGVSTSPWRWPKEHERGQSLFPLHFNWTSSTLIITSLMLKLLPIGI